MLGRRSPAAPPSAPSSVPAPAGDAVPGNGATARRGSRAEARRSRHRHRAQHRSGPAVLARAAWPLAAVALVALVALRAAQRDVRSGEGRLAADAFLLSGAEGATSAPVLSPEGLGALHLAVHATVTRAFDRYDSLLDAGRELLVLVAIGSALLLWRTARRLGLGVPASAAAVLLAGLPPLLSSAALLDVPAQFAVPWLLLAALLVAPGRSTRAARGVALVAVAVATLLAPDVALLLLAGVAAALVTGRTATRTRRSAALVAAPVLALVTLLLPRWDAQPDSAGLGVGAAALAAAAFVLVGVLGAWSSDRVRVPAIALVVTAVGAIAVHGRLSGVVVCLPVAALVAAALADEEAFRLPAGARRNLGVAAAAALSAALVVAVVGLVRLPEQEPAAGGGAALLGWVEGNVPPDGRVVVPEEVWAELVHAGGDEDVLRLPGTGAGGNALSPVLTVVRGDPPEGGVVLSRFAGPGAEPVLLVDPSPGVPTVEELSRRESLAAALLANPTTSTGPRADAVLGSAEVDQRLLSLLAALAAQFGVGVRDFPLADGEPDDGPPARRVLLESLGGEPLAPGAAATERLLNWLDAQLPPFAPDAVGVTEGGVLVSFRYVSAPDALVTRSAP